ncbi:cation transporter [Candidatus Woesearchaeota archaeon]|nr:MAG: cation transporter [Candidatus Woesearchaeota archaeon]
MSHNHGHGKKLGWTIILNIIITIAQYIGGIVSGSLALISDASHNLSDVLSLILGYIGEKFSHKGPSRRHSFGFKRVEIFTALINALALVAIAFYILFEAYKRLNSPREISLGLMFGIGSIGLIGNFVSILILNKEKESSVNMRAAYLHLFYDTISSLFVITGAAIIYFTNYIFIDIIASLIIALMIFYSSFDVIKTCLHIFMQGVPEGIDINEVYNFIMSMEGVEDVHNLHIWAINSRDFFLSCHICIGNNYKHKTDEFIKKINELVKEKFHIEHTSVQIERSNICQS